MPVSENLAPRSAGHPGGPFAGLWPGILALVVGIPVAGLLAMILPSDCGLLLRYGYPIPLTILLLGAWGIFLLPRPWRAAGSCTLALTAVWVILAGLWSSGLSDGALIAGVLPFSDARGYAGDALALLHGHEMGLFSSRRPMFSAYLATLLQAMGGYRAALAALAGITAMSALLAAREVRASHGRWIAAFLLLSLFLYYRRYVGQTMTEHLGLTLGCLSFAACWRGLRAHALMPWLAGLFLLALALNTRAGPFFLLPVLVLWTGRLFARNRFSWRTCLLAGACVGLGFLCNAWVLREVGQPTGAFSNFSDTLYGLLAGGDWKLLTAQHPELSSLPGPERARAAYALCWDLLRNDPIRLIEGAARAWKGFFLGTTNTVFSYLFIRGPRTHTLIQDLKQGSDMLGNLMGHGMLPAAQLVTCMALFFVCNLLATCWAMLRLFRIPVLGKPWDTYLAACGLGVLVSVPFIPPWDAGNMRVYAAVMPLLTCYPLAAAFLIIRRIRPVLPHAIPPGGPLYAMVCLVFLACTVIPVGIASVHRPMVTAPPVCPPGERGLQLSPRWSAGVALTQDATTAGWDRLSPEALHYGLRLHQKANPAGHDALLTLRSGQNVYMAYDRLSGDALLLTTRGKPLFGPICGMPNPLWSELLELPTEILSNDEGKAASGETS